MLQKRMSLSVAASVLLLIINSHNARAQSEPSKFEAGVQLSTIRLTDSDPTKAEAGRSFAATDLGLGGRFGYNINRNFALEGEINFFPEDREGLTREGLSLINKRRTQGLFGVKAGMRSDRVGIFGKLRPGFMHSSYGREVLCVNPPCPFLPESKTRFALDLGGVVEVYTSRRILTRFDFGDTIIRGGNLLISETAMIGRTAFPRRDSTTHNFQFSAGVGFRF